MRQFAFIAALGFTPLSLVACASAPPAPQEVFGPFVINEALAGRTVGRGQFSAITGAERSFVVTFDGRMEGDVFVLDEEIRYAIGEPESFTWRLRQTAPGEWRGAREGVIGEAVGRQEGDVFRLTYLLKVGGRTLRFRDLFYLEPGTGDIINRAKAGYFGFNVGKVNIRIERDAEVVS